MGLGLVDKPHLRRFKRKLDTFLDETFVKKTDKATTTELGIVKPDNTTITVDENGVISSSGSPLPFEITGNETDGYTVIYPSEEE